MLQLYPCEAALQAATLQPEDLRSSQPGVLPHQQLLLPVPTPCIRVLPTPLQHAAADLAPYPGSLQNHFVPPAPIAQPQDY